jgi:hypothetical protein
MIDPFVYSRHVLLENRFTDTYNKVKDTVKSGISSAGEFTKGKIRSLKNKVRRAGKTAAHSFGKGMASGFMKGADGVKGNMANSAARNVGRGMADGFTRGLKKVGKSAKGRYGTMAAVAGTAGLVGYIHNKKRKERDRRFIDRWGKSR